MTRRCKHCGSTREPIIASTPCPTGGAQLDKEDPQYAELGEFDPDGLILIGMQACRDCHRIESFWIEDASAPVRLDWGAARFVGSKPDTNKWQPIETAPENGRFLVYMPTDNRSPIQAAKWGNVKVIGNRFAFDTEKPTYWMPMPEPPK